MSAVDETLKFRVQQLKKDEEHFRNAVASLNSELVIAQKALSKTQSDIKEIEEELSIR